MNYPQKFGFFKFFEVQYQTSTDDASKPQKRVLMDPFSLVYQHGNQDVAHFDLNKFILQNGFPRWKLSYPIENENHFGILNLYVQDFPSALCYIENFLARPDICCTQGHFPIGLEPSGFLILFELIEEEFEHNYYELIMLIKGSKFLELVAPLFGALDEEIEALNKERFLMSRGRLPLVSFDPPRY